MARGTKTTLMWAFSAWWIATATLISFPAAGASEAEDVRFGVFSNHQGEFKNASLIVEKGGHACFAAAVVGSIGDWTYDEKSCVLMFKYFEPSIGKDASIPFKFNKEGRYYTIVGADPSDRNGILMFVTNEIPPEMTLAFSKYPAAVEAERKRVFAMQEVRRMEAERLAREEPEYQRILQALCVHPDTVLSNEPLYARESTPSTRAFRTVLGDRTVHFEEKILVKLLNNLPPDNHWNREQIFARPELSSATIEQFYPMAIEWGKHLNYAILANIATHSNTPRNVVEDLAKRRDVPIGGIEPAQRQMKKYVDEVLAGLSDNSAETFGHLYEYAIQVPKAGWTDNGKAIIMALAKSTLTPTNILVRIANCDDRAVQEAVVSNPNTPGTTLTQLSASRFPEVRAKALKRKEPEPQGGGYSPPAARSAQPTP